MTATVNIETVAARRVIAGVGSFTVHVEAAREWSLRRGRLGRKTWIAICAAMVVAAGLGASDLMRPGASAHPEPSASLPDRVATGTLPSKPVWMDVNRPIRIFDLGGSAFGKLPLTYRAKRLSDASERQDTLRYGDFEDEAPALTLSVSRLGPEPDVPRFFVDVARVAAEEKLAVVRSGLPTLMGTRFGGFEAADLTIGFGAKVRPCIGFRLQPGEGQAQPGPVAIAGIVCGSNGRPVDREGLTCVLDRLDLQSAGDDAALQEFFAQAERRRGQGCGGPHLLAAGASHTWLDGEAVRPVLKDASGRTTRSRRRPPVGNFN